MTSMGLSLGQNGGISLRSFSDNHHCYGCLVRTKPFLSDVNRKYSLDLKWSPQPTVQTLNRIANAVGYVNTITNVYSSVDANQVYSNQSKSGSCEIYEFQPSKRVGDKEDSFSKKLDLWIKSSISEIVSNIDEAPFLVHIYHDDGGKGPLSTSTIRLKREKTDAESWPLIKGRWKTGRSTPNGIILVAELGDKDYDQTNCDSQGSKNNKIHSATRLWGLLIQVKGENQTACYILQTCTVQCLSGFCTHFCLAKMKCFDESVETQLRNLWL